MTSELRPALGVWADALLARHEALQDPKGRPNKAAAAVIEADREAVRSEQAAEIARLRKAIHDFLENKSWFGLAEPPYDVLRAALGEEPKP